MNYSASLLPSGCTVSKACTFPALHSIPGNGWRRRHWSVSYYWSSMSQYPGCTWQSYPTGSNGVNFIINGKSGNDCWLSMSKKLVMHKRKANITLLLLRTRKSCHLISICRCPREWCHFLSEPSSVFKSEDSGWFLVDLANISGIIYVMMHLSDYNNTVQMNTWKKYKIDFPSFPILRVMLLTLTAFEK